MRRNRRIAHVGGGDPRNHRVCGAAACDVRALTNSGLVHAVTQTLDLALTRSFPIRETTEAATPGREILLSARLSF